MKIKNELQVLSRYFYELGEVFREMGLEIPRIARRIDAAILRWLE